MMRRTHREFSSRSGIGGIQRESLSTAIRGIVWGIDLKSVGAKLQSEKAITAFKKLRQKFQDIFIMLSNYGVTRQARLAFLCQRGCIGLLARDVSYQEAVAVFRYGRNQWDEGANADVEQSYAGDEGCSSWIPSGIADRRSHRFRLRRQAL
jgi:hypothetical protein